jgi:glycosyltransferase involved in cell wall biosynthesis
VTDSSEKTESLRILHVVEACAAGVGRHVIGLSKGMVEAGHRVHVAYSPRRLDGAFEKFIRDYEGKIRFYPLELGREVSPVSDLRETFRLFRVMRREGPFDIVHGHSSKGGAVARIAGRLAGIPTVYTPNGLIVSSPELRGAKRFFYASVERILGYFATTRFVAVCEDEGKLVSDLRLAPKGRVVVIENAIEDDDLAAWGGGPDAGAENGAENGPLTFGATMRFSAQKAPRNLIEAFARFLGARPEVAARLVVAGDGELFEEVSGEVRERGLEDEIFLLGWRTDTKEILHSFDVFVLPSLYEGFSYAVLEAMAAGLPIVSTDVFGAKDTVARVPGNVVVPVGDSAALAGGMEKILASSGGGDLREKLRSVGAANRKYVRENFRQSEITARVVALYREVSKKV